MKPGTIIDGKYRIDGVLGAGGMGIVAAAHHLALDEPVAIKVLQPQAQLDFELVARFYREARASAKIRGPHVARVIDVCHSDEHGPYMVMELLDGCDLGRLLKQRGPLPLAEAVEYVLQACTALAEAHRRGIVHRDLKPANLFLTVGPDGKSIVKVLDFGISKMASAGGEITDTVGMLGSYPYMSPEQVRCSKNVDARSDVWSLGVVLFRLLTDKLPFNGYAPVDLLTSILHQPAPPIASLRADLPPGVQGVVDKALAKSPDERFAGVAELAQALAPFAPSAGETVEKVLSTARHRTRQSLPSAKELEAEMRADGDAHTVSRIGALTTETATAVPPRRRRWWLGGGAAAALVLGGIGAFLLAGRHENPPALATATPTPTLTSTSTSTATATPTPSATSTATPTSTATATSTSTPSAVPHASGAPSRPAPPRRRLPNLETSR